MPSEVRLPTILGSLQPLPAFVLLCAEEGTGFGQERLQEINLVMEEAPW